MNLLYFKQRFSWLLLLLSALLPLLLTLVLQHAFGLAPCVLCIYQRVALLAIGLAALLILLAPRCRFLTALGVLLWGYSAFRGLFIAWEQSQRFLEPAQFAACPFRVRFPEWLPLDSWIPSVFNATAACEPSEWALLGLNMPQWMVLMFALHLMLVAGVLCCQLVGWWQKVKDRRKQK